MLEDGSRVETWSTGALAPARRYGAWREAVSATHLPWDMPRRAEPFRAAIRARTIGGVSAVACRCDPCAGRRGRVEVAATAGAWYGLLFVRAGRERVAQAGRELFLGAGDAVIWDGERPIDFAIQGRLAKLSLMIPKARLAQRVPAAEDAVLTALSARGAAGRILAGHLAALDDAMTSIEPVEEAELLQATFALLAAAVRPADGGSGLTTARRLLLRRICEEIEDRLGNPALAPAVIARAAGIAPRTLHQLFADAGTTVTERIRSRRLARCCDELADPGRAGCTVSEIAYRWGFNDAAHFSRSFKQRFGLSPRAWRAAQGHAPTRD